MGLWARPRKDLGSGGFAESRTVEREREREREGMGAGVALAVVGGLISISVASSATIKLLQAASDANQRRVGRECVICRGVGFYICKLCRGNSTIHWSPLYNPVAFNPCLCPTCDAHRVQRCLNCLGKGYC